MLHALFKSLQETPGAGLLGYISFRAAGAALFAFLLGMVRGPRVIAWLERQQVLASAWAGVKKGTYADDKAFAQAWMKARAEALTKAGMEPVLTSW